MADPIPPPPPPIKSEDIHIQRRVGSDGKVVTEYVDASGQPLPIQAQRHHQKADAGFIPPPS
jgi:hypothetical protein